MKQAAGSRGGPRGAGGHGRSRAARASSTSCRQDHAQEHRDGEQVRSQWAGQPRWMDAAAHLASFRCPPGREAGTIDGRPPGALVPFRDPHISISAFMGKRCPSPRHGASACGPICTMPQ